MMCDQESWALFCPECNVQVEARVVGQETTASTSEAVPYDEICHTPHAITITTFAVCPNCQQPFLIEDRFIEIPGEVTLPQGRTILHPTKRSFEHDGVPETIIRAHQHAAHAYSVGLYEPCVIMCRKALEGITEELGASDRNLFGRIRSLRDSGQINGKLAEWADGLRLIGNDAAHDLQIQLGQQDARDSLEFLEALLAYTFTLTRRFEEFQARRAQSAQA